MALASFTCEQCGETGWQERGAINRARRRGARLFCNRKCAGLARRQYKTDAQKKTEKAAYDREYRKKNSAVLKAKKHAYFKRTYDPVKAAVERKKTMPRHIEYCRRPEYRAWKHAYDRRYIARRNYGSFAEAAILATDLNREIKRRTTNYEIRQEAGTWGKVQRRKRDASVERPRT